MLALVCKTFDGVQAIESCDIKGAINKNYGLHGLRSSVGCTIDRRFPVICLADLRPYVGEFIADDPQRRLDLLKPKLPGGEIPRGFLGYDVNSIHIDNANLWTTTSGHGLRETLFYRLFSHLQVYRTREDMLQALPLIREGALSLDGGIIRSPGVFYLGDSSSRVQLGGRVQLRDERVHHLLILLSPFSFIDSVVVIIVVKMAVIEDARLQSSDEET